MGDTATRWLFTVQLWVPGNNVGKTQYIMLEFTVKCRLPLGAEGGREAGFQPPGLA